MVKITPKSKTELMPVANVIKLFGRIYATIGITSVNSNTPIMVKIIPKSRIELMPVANVIKLFGMIYAAIGLTSVKMLT